MKGINPNSIPVIQLMVSEWKKNLHNTVLEHAYTTSKDHLLLNFIRQGEQIQIRIQTQWRELLVMVDHVPFQKQSNYQEIFSEVFGHQIQDIFMHQNDRSFSFVFDNDYRLFFKWYGSLANVLLFEKEQLITMFRPSIINDKSIVPSSFLRDPTMVLENRKFGIRQTSGQTPELVEITEEAIKNKGIVIADSYTEALSEWSRRMDSWCRFTQQKNQLTNSLNKQMKRQAELYQNTERALQVLLESPSPALIGDMIMSSMHLIPPFTKQMELTDWTSGKQLMVKFKKDLSPQENAAIYYKKSKLRQMEMELLKKRMSETKKAIMALESQLSEINRAEWLKELKPFIKKEESKEKIPIPFHVFNKDGFEIRVGKSAAGNDELTTRYASSNDLWLHARGIAGSHVVIRNPNKTLPPKAVIEFAGSLAAYYSKARGSEWVPVSYTLKKFVRKPKGAEPGQVKLDKEEVMVVKPSNN